MTSPETGFKLLVDALDKLRVPFLVGGSLASSIHGIVRATVDIDLVADLPPSQVEPLVKELGAEFYADAAMIRESLKTGRAFNLIHYASSYKFDIFPLSPDPYYQQQFQRRRLEETVQFGRELKLPIATPEDTILTKLAWYRTGGEVSERQWHDVRGVIEVQKGRLDLAYLRKWAAHLRVEELLERIFGECEQRLR